MDNFIMLDIEEDTQEQVIEIMANKLIEHNKIKSLDVFVNAVKKRELEFTTGFGNGIAIPHGKSDAVKESCYVFAKLKKKVEWNAMDKEPVDLVFLLAIPTEEACTTHLKLLSTIAMAIMEKDFVDKLRGSNSEHDIYNVLKEIEKEKA